MAGGSAHRDADVAREAARDVSPRVWRPLISAALFGAALINLVAGLWWATAGDRIGDFTQVMAWSAEWLRGGNPYAAADSLTDYPPNALVMLAPFAALPTHVALPFWIAINVVLSAAIGWMASRLANFARWAIAFAALILMLPPFRTLNQFSIASFAPALAGFLLAPRYPVVAGIAIGLSLMKPHIGGPVLLWAIAARRWKTVATAAAVPLLLSSAYALHARVAPIQLAREYMQAVSRTQNRAADDLIPGVTNLAPLLHWTGAEPTALQFLIASTLGGLLLAIYARRRADFDLRFLSAACLLSLLSFRHLSYNLLLAIPALAFAWTRATRTARILTAVSFTLLIASPPTIWRHLLEPRGWTMPGDAVVPHVYRAVLCALMLAVLLLRSGDRVRRR